MHEALDAAVAELATAPELTSPPDALTTMQVAAALGLRRALPDPETVLTSAALDDTVIRLRQRTGSVSMLSEH